MLETWTLAQALPFLGRALDIYDSHPASISDRTRVRRFPRLTAGMDQLHIHIAEYYALSQVEVVRLEHGEGLNAQISPIDSLFDHCGRQSTARKSYNAATVFETIQTLACVKHSLQLRHSFRELSLTLRTLEDMSDDR